MFDKLRAKLEGTKTQLTNPMPKTQRTDMPNSDMASKQMPPVTPEPIHTPQGDLPPVPAGIVPPTAQAKVQEPAPAGVTPTAPLSPTMAAAMNSAKPPMAPEARTTTAPATTQSVVASAPQPAVPTSQPSTSFQQSQASQQAQPPMSAAAATAIPSTQEPAELAPVKGTSLHTVNFADIWYTPENIAYIRDVTTSFALRPIETADLEDFKRVLEQSFQGISSYAVQFGGDTYRVERVKTSDGIQYNCRKMPMECPEIETLGFAPGVVKHLTSLSRAAGLLLFAGPTGQGKTTTVSALMKRYLNTDGGFLYTIEDPPEMPLRGLYHAKNGGLGLCKQTPVENDQWGAGLRSALRSKPRYILVGEIRTPETASQCLVAATSGHLVLSTIHASGVEDALNSMIKYAASTGLDNSLVSDLLARGILGVVHQRLEGTTQLKLVYQYAFANPNPNSADQMRMTIRDGNINLATFMEQQHTKMDRGLPLFRD